MAATPPPYYPPQQQSGNKVWLWVLLAVVAFCIVAMVGLFFAGKSMMNQSLSLVSCSVNAELARDAVVAYALDHDGKLPDAAHWQDDVKPYYERLYKKLASEMELQKMPDWINFKIAKPGEVLECAVGPDTKTGFAFNSLLAGKNSKDIENLGVTLVIWETTTPAYNASGDPSLRGPAGSKYKIFGQERPYMDVPYEGSAEFLDSGNSKFDIQIDPKDGLEKEPVLGTNPDPRPKEAVK